MNISGRIIDNRERWKALRQRIGLLKGRIGPERCAVLGACLHEYLRKIEAELLSRKDHGSTETERRIAAHALKAWDKN